MGSWSADEITRRAQEAEGERLRITSWVDECLAYSMPWRRKYGAKNRQDFDRLFDSTSLIAVPRFAGKLQAGICPQGGNWFKIEAGPLVPKMMVDQVNRELDLPTKLIHAAADASAFHNGAQELMADLGVGTGAMMITKGDGVRSLLKIDTPPPWQLGIEVGPLGTIDNVYWAKGFKAWMLPQLWPAAEWPEAVVKMIADKSTQEVQILQASYYDPDIRGWRLAIVCRSGAGDRSLVFEKTYRTNPWIIPRYWTAGGPWGRGPLMLALPDIRTANKTVEMVLTAAAYQLAPPLAVLHDGVLNPDTIRIAPRALIKVGRTGGPQGRSIEPLDVGSKVDLAQIVLQEQRTNIKNALHDSQLPPLAGAVRSASEIIERTKELAQDDSQAFTRLTHDFVPGVVSRVLDICDEMKVAGIDFKTMQPDRIGLKVTLTGPLARAQALEDAQNTVQWMEAGKAMLGDEGVAHGVVVEDVMSYLGRKFGADPSLIRTAVERQAIEQAAGAAAGAAMQGGAQPAGGGAQAAPYALPSAAPLQLPAPQ